MPLWNAASQGPLQRNLLWGSHSWLLLGQRLCDGSCSPYMGENAWISVWKPSSTGTGGIREEIICAAFLWVPGELICGMLRHLLCTFASTDASGQHRLSLHHSVGIAHTQSMTGFGKKDFCSCIIIRSFCHVTDWSVDNFKGRKNKLIINSAEETGPLKVKRPIKNKSKSKCKIVSISFCRNFGGSLPVHDLDVKWNTTWENSTCEIVVEKHQTQPAGLFLSPTCDPGIKISTPDCVLMWILLEVLLRRTSPVQWTKLTYWELELCPSASSSFC